MIDRDYSRDFLVLLLCMCGFQVLNVVIMAVDHRDVIAHLDAIQAEQRAGFSALAAAPPSSHGKVEMKWMGEGITRAYVATHVYCSNFGAWVDRANLGDTVDLDGRVVAKWDDCQGTWVSVAKGKKQ